MMIAPLPGRNAVGRVATPEGGPRDYRKVRKILDGNSAQLWPNLMKVSIASLRCSVLYMRPSV